MPASEQGRPERDNQDLHRQALEALPAAIYCCDAGGRITMYNDAAAELWGRRPTVGKDMWCGSWKTFRADGSLVAPDQCPMAVALREGRAVRGQPIIIERPDGTTRRVMPFPRPFLDQLGRVTGAVNMLVDTTDLHHAEMKATRNEQRLWALANTTPAILWSADADGRVTWVSDRWFEFTGLAPPVDPGKWAGVLHPEDAERCIAAWAEAVESGTDHEVEARYRRHDGRYRWFLTRAAPVRDGRGLVTGWLGSSTDIDDRRAAEQAARESEERLRMLMTLLPAGMYACDAEGRLTYYNKQAAELWGHEPSLNDDRTRFCACHKTFLPDGTFVPPERTPMAVAVREGRSFRDVQATVERPDGTRFVASVSIDPIRDGSGRPIGAINVFQDITRRTEAERGLRDSEERLRLATQTGKVGIWDWDISRNQVARSESLLRIYGVEAGGLGDDIEGFESLLHPDDLDRVRAAIRRSLDDGTSFELEYRAVRPDGKIIWLFSNAQVLRLGGTPVRMLGATLEITDRKRAEAELAETKDSLALQVATLTRLHELSMRLAVTQDLGKALQAVLDTFVEAHRGQFGLLSLFEPASGRLRIEASRGFDEQALDMLCNVVPDRKAGACGAAFATRARAVVEDVLTDPRFENFRRIAQHVGFRAVHSTPIFTSRGEIQGVLSVHFRDRRTPNRLELQLADLCARHAADLVEAARIRRDLQETEERFRLMADTAPVLIWVDGMNGREFVNREYLRFLGQPVEEIHGKGWQKFVHEEDREPYLAVYRGALEARQTFRSQYRFLRHDGEFRWMQSVGAPRVDSQGRFIGYVGCSVDITEMKQSEVALQTAKDMAETANQSKDRFLAILSHELRTPLTPILIAAGLMEKNQNLPASIRDDAAMIRDNVRLETKLIDDLLDLSRIASGKLLLQPESVDLNDAVIQACAICRRSFDEKQISLRCDLDEEAGKVRADPARLKQVFWNVLNNAAKFTPEGGRVEVRTARDAGDRVRVTVRDSGIGIAPESLPGVFKAFEQGDPRITRRFGGLGLGMAITNAIVKLHNGDISAQSEGLGKGATFSILLPSEEPAPPGSETDSPAEPPRQNALRILAVEDHSVTAAALQRMLTASGYHVRLAESMAAAEALLDAEEFDLILSDIGLPDASGYELMRRARERRPIPGIAMSGYGMAEDIAKSKEAGFAEHLVKPVDVSQLERAIRQVVAAAK